MSSVSKDLGKRSNTSMPSDSKGSNYSTVRVLPANYNMSNAEAFQLGWAGTHCGLDVDVTSS